MKPDDRDLRLPFAGPVGILCHDPHLKTLLEVELGDMGLSPISSPDRSIRLLVADTDSVPAAEAATAAAACGVPLICIGRTAPVPEGTAPAGIPPRVHLRRPFPLPALRRAVLDALPKEAALPAGNTDPLPPTMVLDRDAHTPAPDTPPPVSITLHKASREAVINGRVVQLSQAEMALASQLLAHRGEAVPREDLAALLGGGGNSVDVYVCHLRAKLEKPLGRRLIDTVRGVGYRLN